MKKILITSAAIFAIIITFLMTYSERNENNFSVGDFREELSKEKNMVLMPAVINLVAFKPMGEEGSQISSKSPVDIVDSNELDLPENFSLSAMNDLEMSSALIAGFTDDGAKAILSNTPEALLSIDDMPEQIRDEIKENLRFIEENGYEEVSDLYSHEIVNIVNYLNGSSRKIQDISFIPSIIPDDIEASYNYVGYSYPNSLQAQSLDVKLNDTVRRVYQHTRSNDLLILEESSLSGGGATLLREYVNDSIGEFPAIYLLKKTERGEMYSSLNWITDTFVYTLYQVGNIDSSTQQSLNRAAHSVSKQNKNNNDGSDPSPLI